MVVLNTGRAMARLLAISTVHRPLRGGVTQQWTQHAMLWTAASRSGPAASMCTAASPESELERRLRDGLAKAIEGEARKHASLAKEKASAASAEALSRWATLVTANLYQIPEGASRVTVEDWENDGAEVTLKFDLEKYRSGREEAEAAFTKARKLRRGSAVVQELLEKSEKTQAALERLNGLVAAAGSDATSLALVSDEVAAGFKKLSLKPIALPGQELQPPNGKGLRGQGTRPLKGGKQVWAGRRFVSPSGLNILVGRNRGENEELSLSIAKEPDIWFHVRGSPGAHVILQLSQASKEARKRAAEEGPPEECLQLAADLAAHYSEVKGERRSRVSYTTPKHINKPNGAPLGAVNIRKELGTAIGFPENVVELAEAELVSRAEKPEQPAAQGSRGSRATLPIEKSGAQGKQRRRKPPPPPPDP